MPKSSRRKQSKPQHLLSEEEDNRGNGGAQEVTSSVTGSSSSGKQSTQEGQDGSDFTDQSSIQHVKSSQALNSDSGKNEDGDSTEEYSADENLARHDAINDQIKHADEKLNVSENCSKKNTGVSKSGSDKEEEELQEEKEAELGRRVELPRSFWNPQLPPNVLDRYCIFCKQVTDSPAELQAHLAKHSMELPFVCQVCLTGFKSKRQLQYHNFMQHGVQSMESGIPEDLSQDRKRNLETVQPISSQEEAINLNKNSSADYHQPSGKMDSFNSYASSACPVSVSSPIDMASKRQKLDSVTVNTHLQYSRAIPSLMSAADATMTQGFDPTCINQADGSAALDPNQEMMKSCQVCAKVFPKPSDLKRHMMCHTGEKPFKCEFCNKPFRAKSSMHYHLKAAHGLDIELSPGLEERYLRMKTRAHMNMLQRSQLFGIPQQTTSDATSELPLFRGEVDEIEDDTRSTDSLIQTSGLGNDNMRTQGQSYTGNTNNLSKTSQLDSSISEKSEQSVSNQSENSSIENYMSTDKGIGAGSLVISSEEPFKRNQIQIQNETVLVTRLDGLNLVNGETSSIYKCYLCGKMFTKLSSIQSHLSLHFDRQIVSFECCFCDEIFQFKTQMRAHIRKKHSANLKRKLKTDSSSNCENAKNTSSSSDSPSTNQNYKIGPTSRIAQKEDHSNPSRLSGKKNKAGYLTCRYCRKIFNQPMALQKHMRRHFWNRNCFCRVCGKSFNQYTSLQQHIWRFHWKLGTAQMSPKKSNFFHSYKVQGHSLSDSLRKLRLPEMKLKTEEQDGNQNQLELQKKTALAKRDVTVVMPTTPPLENGDASDAGTSLNSSEIDWSESLSENGQEFEDRSATGIRVAPKRSLMSFRKENGHGRSSRKNGSNSWSSGKSPVHVNLKSESSFQDTNNNEPLQLTMNHTSPDIRQGSSPDARLPSYSLNATNSLLIAKALAAQTSAASTSTSTSLLGKNISPPGMVFPPTSSSTLPHSAFPTMSLPVSIQVPNESRSSKSPSPASLGSSSKSDASPEERETLVGYPRVQWSPHKSYGSGDNNNWRFSMYYPENALSTDGRKVSSLSRTHSRLPIVHMPVNRESICKPTTMSDGRTVYRCPFCSKDFVSFSDINRHMDFHEGKEKDIRPYKCQYCDYYARTNSQLKVHMMRHQGIREYCCKLCNYKGVTQSDLNRHMKSQIHMLKSRNACTHCGEGFVTTKNLEKHLDGNCIVKMQKLQNGGMDVPMQEVM